MLVDPSLRSQWLGNEINAHGWYLLDVSVSMLCKYGHPTFFGTRGIRGMSKLQPGVKAAPIIPHPRQAQPFVMTSQAYLWWLRPLSWTCPSGVCKPGCCCASRAFHSWPSSPVGFAFSFAESILRLLFGFLVLTEFRWFHLRWKQYKTTTKKHQRRNRIKKCFLLFERWMQMCFCSVLIYSRCSPNISQSIIACLGTWCVYYIAEKSVEEEVEGWGEKVPAWRLLSHHFHYWNIKYLMVPRTGHWSRGSGGKVCWEWCHYVTLSCCSVKAVTFIPSQGYSQYPLSMTFWRKCGWVSVVHFPFLETKHSACVCLCVCVYARIRVHT